MTGSRTIVTLPKSKQACCKQSKTALVQFPNKMEILKVFYNRASCITTGQAGNTAGQDIKETDKAVTATDNPGSVSDRPASFYQLMAYQLWDLYL